MTAGDAFLFATDYEAQPFQLILAPGVTLKFTPPFCSITAHGPLLIHVTSSRHSRSCLLTFQQQQPRIFDAAGEPLPPIPYEHKQGAEFKRGGDQTALWSLPLCPIMWS